MQLHCILVVVFVNIDRGSTGSRGSFDPPLLEVGGQAMLFDPPTFSVCKNPPHTSVVFCNPVGRFVYLFSSALLMSIYR